MGDPMGDYMPSDSTCPEPMDSGSDPDNLNAGTPMDAGHDGAPKFRRGVGAEHRKYRREQHPRTPR